MGTSELPPPLPPPLLRQFAAATATADFRHDLVKAMRWWRRVRTSAQFCSLDESCALARCRAWHPV